MTSGRLSQVATGLVQCNAIFTDSRGNLFIGNDSGVFEVCGNIFKRFDAVPEMTVKDIAEEKNGTLWIATDGNGLWHWAPGTNMALPLSLPGETINSNSIYGIYID